MRSISLVLAAAALIWCAFLNWLWSYSANPLPLVAFVPAFAAAVALIAVKWRYAVLLRLSTVALGAAAFAGGFLVDGRGRVSAGIMVVICYGPALAALVLAIVNEETGTSAGSQ